MVGIHDLPPPGSVRKHTQSGVDVHRHHPAEASCEPPIAGGFRVPGPGRQVIDKHGPTLPTVTLWARFVRVRKGYD